MNEVISKKTLTVLFFIAVMVVAHSPHAVADNMQCTFDYKIDVAQNVTWWVNWTEGRGNIYCSDINKIFTNIYAKTKKKQWWTKHFKGTGEFSSVSSIDMLFGTYIPQGGSIYKNGTVTLKLIGSNGDKFQSLKIQRHQDLLRVIPSDGRHKKFIK